MALIPISRLNGDNPTKFRIKLSLYPVDSGMYYLPISFYFGIFV